MGGVVGLKGFGGGVEDPKNTVGVEDPKNTVGVEDPKDAGSARRSVDYYFVYQRMCDELNSYRDWFRGYAVEDVYHDSMCELIDDCKRCPVGECACWLGTRARQVMKTKAVGTTGGLERTLVKAWVGVLVLCMNSYRRNAWGGREHRIVFDKSTGMYRHGWEVPSVYEAVGYRAGRLICKVIQFI